jgi:hypothetical protein
MDLFFRKKSHIHIYCCIWFISRYSLILFLSCFSSPFYSPCLLSTFFTVLIATLAPNCSLSIPNLRICSSRRNMFPWKPLHVYRLLRRFPVFNQLKKIFPLRVRSLSIITFLISHEGIYVRAYYNMHVIITNYGKM